MKEALLYLENKELTKICIADSLWTRFMGLMGKTSEQITEMGGLLIKPCSQIHMFFMKTPIDVVYLDCRNEIVKIDYEVPTWKCCRKVKGSVSVLELPKGAAMQLGLKEYDQLEVLR